MRKIKCVHLCFICSAVLFCFFWKFQIFNQPLVFLTNIFPKPKCPGTHIITVEYGGRLGNNIWEYMSLLAIMHLCKEFTLTPYISDELKQNMVALFERVNVSEISELSTRCLENYTMHFLEITKPFDKAEIFKDNTTVYLDLAKYSARYEDIIKYGVDEIVDELRFHENYRTSSYIILDEIRKRFRMSRNNVTYVGMHYRGTDYINFLKINYTQYTGPPNHTYYLKAMDYFKNKFNNVIFILITIDFEWLETNRPFLEKNNNLVVNPINDDRIKDLVLLSNCNHSIINYGTFGATAALFAKGITVVYDLGLPLDYDGGTIALGVAHSLPNWHLMK